MKSAFFSLSAALCLASACALETTAEPVLDEPEQEALDLEGTSLAIRSGVTSSDAPFSLGILPFFSTINQTDLCSAIALTPHWLLTAGHCLDEGGDWIDRVSVYRQSGSGSQWLGNLPVTAFRSSTYNPDDASTDVGLIRIFGDLNPLPADYGRFYTDTKSPFSLGSVKVAGWGWGNTASNCTLTQNIPVTGSFTMNLWGSTILNAVQNLGDQICEGDSGAPWYFRVGSRRLIVGVNSRGTQNFSPAICSNRCVAPDEQIKAPRISRWIDWIEDATAFGNLPVTCSSFTVAHDNGTVYSYRRCVE